MKALNDLDTDETRTMIVSLENELARFSLASKTPEVKQAVRNCVYHVLLQAITLSKDPATSVDEVKRLFELAKSIIANAELNDEKELQGRLDDLINSIIDQSDISIQFKNFSSKANEYFDTISMILKQEKDLVSEDLQNIHNLLDENKTILKGLSRKKSVFKIVTTVLLVFVVLAFTIFTTVVILVYSLSNNDSPSGSIRSNSAIESPANPKAKEPG